MCTCAPQRSKLYLQVCDTVAELAAITLAGGGSGWPELLPFLSQAVQSGQPRLMEASLLIFAQLAGHMMDTLLQFLGTLLQVHLRRHHWCTQLGGRPQARSLACTQMHEQKVHDRRCCKRRWPMSLSTCGWQQCGLPQRSSRCAWLHSTLQYVWAAHGMFAASACSVLARA